MQDTTLARGSRERERERRCEHSSRERLQKERACSKAQERERGKLLVYAMLVESSD